MKTMKRLLTFLLAVSILIGVFGTVTFAEGDEPLTLDYVGVAKISKSTDNANTAGGLDNLGRLYITIGDTEWDAAFQYDLSQIPSDQIVKKVTWRTNYSEPAKLLQITGFKTNEQLGTYVKSWNDLQTMGYNTPYMIRSQAVPSDAEKETITAIVREADPENEIAEETTTTTEWVIDMTDVVKNAISSGEKYLNFVVDISAGYSADYISMWWKPQPRLVIETEPAPKEKELNFVGTGRFSVNEPDNVYASGNWDISTEQGSAGMDAFFQYDLSSLPKNHVITKATWKALYHPDGKKYIEVKGFNTTENLGQFTKSYNALLNAGYNNPYTIRSSSIISDDEIATVSATDGKLTIDYQQWNIDMTTAVQNAVANNQQYLSFVVNATAGYAYGYIPRYWSPQPILVVETKKVASVTIKGLTDGKMTAYNCVGFDINAEVVAGEEKFETVVLTITDANNETQTYDEPIISGNNYKWSFSGGLSEGTYTAVVTATAANGEILTSTAIIEVEPTIQSLMSKPDLLAKAGAKEVNFSINGDPSYFQHELPQIPDGAVITSAKWYVMKGTFNDNTNYPNGKFVFSKLNTQEKLSGCFAGSNVAGYAEITALESFAESDIIKNTIVNTTLNGYTNDFAEVDLTAAVRTAYVNNEKYFGYMVKLTDGYYTVSNYATQYRPFMVITYDMDYEEPVEAVENHTLTITDGTATASVTVNEGSAVLIIAAYNGEQLLDVVMDDTIEDSQLTTFLTNSTPGVTFKSFVWESMDTLTPLLPIK